MIYAVNVPVTNYRDTVLCAYQFLTFCAQFPLLHVHGANFAASTVLESNTGSTNAASPSRFFSSAASFVVGHVGKYIAVRDTNNPSNTAIVQITAFISSTEVQCNAPVANFSVTATNLSFRIFDGTIVPAGDDFFVITNLAGQFPAWQTIVYADLASTAPAYEILPIGGYDVGTETILGPTTGKYYGFTTMVQAFFAAEPVQGWCMTWTEQTGGVGSNRNATWFGTVGSTHAAAATGFPADASYAGVFGATAATANNISRTNVANSIAQGSFGNEDGSGVIAGYTLIRKSSVGAVDVLTAAAYAVDPFTAQSNDYDAILIHDSPHSFRGYVPGVRHLNNTLVNRTLISGGNTYVIGNGIGIAWNGKPTV